MDIRKPHNIVPLEQVVSRPQAKIEIEQRVWLPLTEQEAQGLIKMSEDQKADWFKKLPMHEKLRRFAEAEKVFDEMEKSDG